jgi:hypothetical protein
MKHLLYLLLAIPALCRPGSVQAQVVVYDTMSPSLNPVSTSSEPFANNPVFGDSLVVSQGGVLRSVGFAVFNGSNGNILTGTATIRIFDNTVPYASGDLTGTHPLLATLTTNLDFTLPFGGLPPAFVANRTADASALNVTVPQNILVTEEFVETSGTSTAWGTVYTNDPTVGSSPPTVYRKSTVTAEGLYTGSTGQYAFQVTLAPVPEPNCTILCGIALAGAFAARR